MTGYSDLKLLAEASVGVADISLVPDVVLALIAEIEHLGADNRSKNGSLAAYGKQISALQRAVKSRDKVLAKISGERDQLKALTKKQNDRDLACPLHQREKCLACAWPPMEKSQLAALKAENEALRKDAERYRWLKDKNSDPSIVSSSEKHAKYFFEFMLCGDDLDTVIDAAMSKKS